MRSGRTYNAQLARIQFNNDGRRGLCGEPAQRPAAADLEQAQNLFCHSPAQAANFAAWRARNFAGSAPCLLNAYRKCRRRTQYMQQARSWQSSFGFQRQFGSTMARRSRLRLHARAARKGHARQRQPDVQPGHRREYPVHRIVPTLPYPEYGIMSMIPHNTRSEIRRFRPASRSG